VGGFALARIVHELEDGSAFIERALMLNPNLAAGWHLSGWVYLYLGEPEVTIERCSRAMRLSPLDPFTYLASSQISGGYFFAGRYDEASYWAEKGLREQPNWAGSARMLAASNALAGRIDQAHKAVARLRQIDPTARVSAVRQRPYRRPEDLARYEEGLRKAGLPE
jgi:tetratricopeptide (TPR) repeat protein